MALERELRTFRRALPGLLQDKHNHERFALVHGAEVNSIWDTLDKALDQGYRRFGLEPFLVKKIVEAEEPRYCSRNIF